MLLLLDLILLIENIWFVCLGYNNCWLFSNNLVLREILVRFIIVEKGVVVIVLFFLMIGVVVKL